MRSLTESSDCEMRGPVFDDFGSELSVEGCCANAYGAQHKANTTVDLEMKARIVNFIDASIHSADARTA